jgi:fucokinase
MKPVWDYLIVTAANEGQAGAYREQLGLRRDLGLISEVGKTLVVPDPDGRRIGSGGSTILCLLEIISRELKGHKDDPGSPTAWGRALNRVRALIVHAGGDARRLPVYSPCGKVFIPVPGESDSALGLTLLDRQLPRYLSLPAPPEKAGQVIVTSGDVFLDFDSTRLRFDKPGITAVGCLADPKLASAHGVFCPSPDGGVRMFLQKPSVEDQDRQGAIDRHGRSVLDIGIMSLDANAALRLVGACHPRTGRGGHLVWTGRPARLILERGLDFYREICCAMGRNTGRESYIEEVRRTGSALTCAELKVLYDAFSPIPFFVETVPACIFLHFGTMRQLMESGADLISLDRGVSNAHAPIILNSEVGPDGAVIGKDAWIEGCRVRAPLSLGGENVVAGVDIDRRIALPQRACLDVLEGEEAAGKKTWFVRCYDIDDQFHLPKGRGGRLNGLPLERWLQAMDAEKDEIWDSRLPAGERTVWKGRFFPAVGSPSQASDWLWLHNLEAATELQKSVWRESRRLSLADMVRFASQEAFHSRRLDIRGDALRNAPARVFRPESGFSASDLAFSLERSSTPEKALWLSGILKEAYRRHGPEAPLTGVESLGLSRILHTWGAAVSGVSGRRPETMRSVLDQTGKTLKRKEKIWLSSMGLTLSARGPLGGWGTWEGQSSAAAGSLSSRPRTRSARTRSSGGGRRPDSTWPAAGRTLRPIPSSGAGVLPMPPSTSTARPPSRPMPGSFRSPRSG